MYRHGYKQIHRRWTYLGFDLQSGYSAPMTKQACSGSGKPSRRIPTDLERKKLEANLKGLK